MVIWQSIGVVVQINLFQAVLASIALMVLLKFALSFVPLQALFAVQLI